MHHIKMQSKNRCEKSLTCAAAFLGVNLDGENLINHTGKPQKLQMAFWEAVTQRWTSFSCALSSNLHQHLGCISVEC